MKKAIALTTIVLAFVMGCKDDLGQAIDQTPKVALNTPDSVNAENSGQPSDEAGHLPGKGHALKLTIAIPINTRPYEDESIKLRRTAVNLKDSEFFVTLTNKTGLNQTISEEWCSWGYFNLRFEILDDAGNVVYTIKKHDIAWDENWHDYTIVEPDEVYVRKVKMNPDQWNVPTASDLPIGSFHHVKERWRIERESVSFKMRAIYSENGVETKSSVDSYQFVYPATDW